MIRQVMIAALSATVLSVAAEAAPHNSTRACAPSDGLAAICGVLGSEDLVQVPRTRWLIASGLALGRPAHLFLIDTRKNAVEVLFSDGDASRVAGTGLASGCPGPPRGLSTDGLGLRADPRGVHMLYAANHGDRRAIEMFRIDARSGRPIARWVDCAPMPAHTLPNAVVPAGKDGLFVSSFYDPDDKDPWGRMARGEATGNVLEWRPGLGFAPVPGGALSGANGLETSADGRWLYVSAWSARKLVALPLKGGVRRDIPLDFMPDNIHRAADGTLLVGGQRTQVHAIARCGGDPCAQPWVVVRVDPARGLVTPMISRPGSPAINYAAGAIEVGRSVYITARGDGRVAHARLADLPSLH